MNDISHGTNQLWKKFCLQRNWRVWKKTSFPLFFGECYTWNTIIPWKVSIWNSIPCSKEYEDNISHIMENFGSIVISKSEAEATSMRFVNKVIHFFTAKFSGGQRLLKKSIISPLVSNFWRTPCQLRLKMSSDIRVSCLMRSDFKQQGWMAAVFELIFIHSPEEYFGKGSWIGVYLKRNARFKENGCFIDWAQLIMVKFSPIIMKTILHNYSTIKTFRFYCRRALPTRVGFFDRFVWWECEMPWMFPLGSWIAR